jgi:hypothetical protein
MASTISAGTSASTAIAIAGDTSGALALQTNNGTTAVTIDTAQKVGIGTTSPDANSLVTISATTPNSKLRLAGGTSQNGLTFASAGGGNQFYVYSQSGGLVTYDDTAGAERMRITSAGDVGIGNTGSTSFKFNVTGTGTSSAAYAFRAEDSGTNNLLSARNDGLINTGTRASSPYNFTIAASANMYVDNSGSLYRTTSSLKYKTDVQNATHGLEDILKLRSVTYKGKTEADGTKIYGGLIAEEVDAAGLTEFVYYAEDGSPDALHYANMVSLCVKAIQELNAKVETQAITIAELQAKVG